MWQVSSRLRFLPDACTGPRTPLQRTLVGATGVNKEVGSIGGWRDLLAAASRLGRWSAPWLSNHTFSRGGWPEGWSKGPMAAWGSQADTSHSTYSSDEANKYGWWKEKEQLYQHWSSYPLWELQNRFIVTDTENSYEDVMTIFAE